MEIEKTSADEARELEFELYNGNIDLLRLDSVVKLKTCYNLFTYNEERAYGGTSKT